MKLLHALLPASHLAARAPMLRSTLRLVVLLGVAVSFSLLPSPASAEDPDPEPTPTVVRGRPGPDGQPSEIVLSPGGDGLAALALITCFGQTNNPHGSGHFHGTVNVGATTTCPVQVPTIHVDTQLQKQSCIFIIFCSWYAYGPIGSATLYNATQASAFSAGAPCVTGTYRGVSTHWVIFPDGSFASGATVKVASVVC